MLLLPTLVQIKSFTKPPALVQVRKSNDVYMWVLLTGWQLVVSICVETNKQALHGDPTVAECCRAEVVAGLLQPLHQVCSLATVSGDVMHAA